MLFDRSRLRVRNLEGADFLHALMAEELCERLAFVSRTFEAPLVSAPATSGLRAAFSSLQNPVFAGPAGAVDVVSDVAQPFLRRFDLALSVNDLHLANDPVMALGEMRGTLKPDGLFLGAALCSGTLTELTDALMAADVALSGGAAMRVAPFGDVRRWGDALSRAGFALPVADEATVTVRYSSLKSLIEDLRAMGGHSILRERRRPPRRLFEAAEEAYRAAASDPDGKLRATFHIAYLSGWAPDASQQRPAKRGSANVRLEDALKAAQEG